MSAPKVYRYALEGYVFRLLKELAAFDTEMPVLVADKLCDAYVRSDIFITPAVKAYLISRLQVVDTSKLYKVQQKSVEKCLKFLYNIDKE